MLLLRNNSILIWHQLLSSFSANALSFSTAIADLVAPTVENLHFYTRGLHMGDPSLTMVERDCMPLEGNKDQMPFLQSLCSL